MVSSTSMTRRRHGIMGIIIVVIITLHVSQQICGILPMTLLRPQSIIHSITLLICF